MKCDNTDLYNIMSGLKGKCVSLYSLAKWKNGLPFKKIDFSNYGKPIIKISELNNGITQSTAYTNRDYNRDVYLTKGDLVFSWSGNPDTSIDVFRYVLEDGWLNQHIFKVTANDKIILKDYLYYILKWLKPIFKEIARNKQTTGLGHVTITDLQAINIVIPDFDLQHKIVNILKPLDDKIELNNAINHNLQQQAQAIFKSWFIDFEPFGGKMPNDWEIVPLERIANFQNGYAFKSNELLNQPSPDCYQVFKQGHIARGGGFISEGTRSWYPKKLALKLEKFVLKKGDILMAMTDMKDNVAILGNTAIMPIDNEYIVNQRVGHLRANGYKGITYPFIYLLTNSTDFLADLRSRANSGVQVNLSSVEIKASPAILPSEKVNTAFSAITIPMFEVIISNQLENRQLSLVRDKLLPKLMSGELDISEVEI